MFCQNLYSYFYLGSECSIGLILGLSELLPVTLSDQKSYIRKSEKKMKKNFGGKKERKIV